MAGTTIGTAYVQILPSAEGIGERLREAVGGDAEHVGADIGGRIGSAIAKAIAALGIGKMISDAITNGMDFETSMAKTSTLFTGTSQELAELEAQILSISNSTGVAASQLAEAAYSAESASVPMENLGGMIEASAKLATAGFTDIDTALSATAKTMNAYGMMSDDVTETQANMERVQRILIQTQNRGITTVGELGASLAQVTPTAAAFGVSFEQVGAALAGMTAQGTPTAQATTQLNSLIAELGKEGTKAADILKSKTGASFADLMEKGWDLNEILQVMSHEVPGMEDLYASISDAQANGAESWGEAFDTIIGQTPEAKQAIIDMFGSIEAGKAAMAILSSDWSGNMDAMSTDADVVGEAYGEMSDTVSFKMQQIKNSLKNMGIEAFNRSAETMMKVLGGIQTILEKVQPALDKLGEAASNLAGAFGQAVSETLGLEEGFSASEVIAAGLTAVINGLASVFGFLAEHMNILIPLLAGLAAGFVAFKVGAGIASLITTITGIATAISGAGGLMAALSALMGPVGWVALAIAALVAIGVTLYKNWDTIKAYAISVWTAIKEFFVTTWENIKTSVTETWQNIINTITTKWEEIKTNAITKWEEIKTTIAEKVTAIKDAISEKIHAFIDAGKELFQGFLDGVTEKWNTIKETVSGFFNGLVDDVKGILGIASPSTVFSDIGTDTIAGYGEGVDSESPSVLDKVSGFANSVVEAASGIVGGITEKAGAVGSWVSGLFGWGSEEEGAAGAAANGAANAGGEVKKGFLSSLLGVDVDVAGIFEKISAASGSAMEKVKTAWEEVSSAVTEALKALATAFDDTFVNLEERLDAHLRRIQAQFQALSKAFKDVATTIRSAFNFNWAMPHIKTPHMQITWEAVTDPVLIKYLGSDKIPHFNVEWYKKAYDNPYLFTKPTVMGFGDGDGGEMVYGHKSLMSDIREATGDDESIEERLDRVIDLLEGITRNGLNANISKSQLYRTMSDENRKRSKATSYNNFSMAGA